MTEAHAHPGPATRARVLELFQESFGFKPEVVARAPGRIEVIGNHTDYNCGTVIGAAIDRGIVAAASLAADGELRFVSDGLGIETINAKRPFSPLAGKASWVNYPLGVLSVLEERGMPLVPGLRFAVASDLPTGAGLSSSAAMELATAVALTHLMGHQLPRTELAGACREAENKFVGVPCGILDQGVSGFGKQECLVHIDCRGPRFSTVTMPGGVRFWVFNTHKKHALLDSLYSKRHAECMSAVDSLKRVYPRINCLADVSSAELDGAGRELGPDEFKRARHVVEEIARVGAFVGALERGDLNNAGALLFASHNSSRLLFENSTDELDFLVERLQGADGVYGARLTGGGFGGAVMAMTDHEFSPDNAAEVANAYAGRFDNPPDYLVCATDDGASLV